MPTLAAGAPECGFYPVKWSCDSFGGNMVQAQYPFCLRNLRIHFFHQRYQIKPDATGGPMVLTPAEPRCSSCKLVLSSFSPSWAALQESRADPPGGVGGCVWLPCVSGGDKLGMGDTADLPHPSSPPGLGPQTGFNVLCGWFLTPGSAIHPQVSLSIPPALRSPP